LIPAAIVIPVPSIRRQLPEKNIWDFMDQFLVHCPRCNLKALVEDRGEEFEPRLILVCSSCALKKSKRFQASVVYTGGVVIDGHDDAMLMGAPVDPHFWLPLWLQTDCRGNALWFYNLEHMEFVEDYVAAKLRERKPHPHYRNRTMSSRLPTWIKLARNRDAVLKCIGQLHTKL
jgi:hypothetical protein